MCTHRTACYTIARTHHHSLARYECVCLVNSHRYASVYAQLNFDVCICSLVPFHLLLLLLLLFWFFGEPLLCYVCETSIQTAITRNISIQYRERKNEKYTVIDHHIILMCEHVCEFVCICAQARFFSFAFLFFYFSKNLWTIREQKERAFPPKRKDFHIITIGI